MWLVQEAASALQAQVLVPVRTWLQAAADAEVGRVLWGGERGGRGGGDGGGGVDGGLWAATGGAWLSATALPPPCPP